MFDLNRFLTYVTSVSLSIGLLSCCTASLSASAEVSRSKIPINGKSTITSVKVPGGTPVMVRLTNEVSSATVAVGQSIDFKVVGDVVINNKTVVKDGTLGHAQIVALDKRQMIGEPGSVTIGDFYVLALDGSRIPLSATINNVGKSKQTTSMIVGLLICWPFLFMKGHDAVIPAGTEKTVYTAATITVEVE